jgi:HIRAN domain
MKRIDSEIRGAKFMGACALLRFRNATPKQPLILMREARNPADFNALFACDMNGAPLGYVAREHAAIVSPEMDQGFIWRAKVTRRTKVKVAILLWREEPGSLEEIMKYQKEKV